MKTIEEIAKEVIDGKWGQGTDRKARLEKAGYNYRQVQDKVNELCSPNKPKEVINVDEETFIWNFLIGKGLSPIAVAGLMGNLKAESNFKFNNLQNNGNAKLGVSDSEFTTMLNNRTYSKEKFINDAYGYSIAQWTSPGRKKNFYEFMQNYPSFDDKQGVCEFFYKELQNYTVVINACRNGKTIREISDVVLTKYERPKDQSEAVKRKRASFGQEVYNRQIGKTQVVSQPTQPTQAPISTPTQPKKEEKKCIEYVVKRGDTLSKIAKMYRTTITKIAQDNGIRNPNIIYTGQKLKIYL